MSWQDLSNLLQVMFREINQGQLPLDPVAIRQRYGDRIDELLSDPDISQEFVNLGNGIWSPRAYETIRILSNLRQRFQQAGNGVGLVDQLRAEIVPRRRPSINLDASQEHLIIQQYARICGYDSYSDFQITGWKKIYETIHQSQSIIITAPTGSGKTEVFLVPIMHHIAQSLVEGTDTPRYIFIYPRVELLKDQLKRVFEYSYRASELFSRQQRDLFQGPGGPFQHPVVVGVKYADIRAEFRETRRNRAVFDDDDTFLLVPECPITDGRLQLHRPSTQSNGITYLRSQNGIEYQTVLSRNDIRKAKPHILVTTLESLNELTLHPDFDSYLRSIHGIVFDEIHLYNSLYGAHVSQVICRLENLIGKKRKLVRIGSSATVSHPDRFAHSLFYGAEGTVKVHQPDTRWNEAVGLETIVFLRSPDPDQGGPPPQSTLVQTIMATGHAIIESGRKAIVFNDSIDNAARITQQVHDAETSRQLWSFRTLRNVLQYDQWVCGGCVPATCPIYLAGECWRGLIGGTQCDGEVPNLKEDDLSVAAVSSFHSTDFREYDVVVSTASLEVGVDDDRIQSTIHYRPPYSMFSFIQRRGRAGRQTGETAYTTVVLGRTASDEFYFRRRNRLMNGENFELPINPDNPVIRQMHARFERELGRIRDLRGSDIRAAIFDWMIEEFQQSVVIGNVFSRQWLQLASRDVGITSKQDQFRNWISEQHSLFKTYLNLRLVAQEIVEVVPSEQFERAVNFRENIDQLISSGDSESRDAVVEIAIDLRSGLATLSNEMLRAADNVEYQRLENLRQRLGKIVQSIQEVSSTRFDPHQIGSLYYFFNHLHETLNNGELGKRIINYVPGMIRLILQSLFHIGQVEYYVPDTYFQEVKPIVVETWTAAGRQEKELYLEDSTRLSSMLIPYKPFYRYFAEGEFMAVVRTENRREWVDWTTAPTEVRLRIFADGIGDRELNPRRISVRPIRADQEGHGIVRLCETCFSVHNYNRLSPCGCGATTRPVRLYSRALVDRTAEVHQSEQMTQTLHYCRDMEGTTRILGAIVEYRGEYEGRQATQSFVARYHSVRDEPQPLAYSLRTRGVKWDLSNVVERLIDDENLNQQLRRFDKVLSDELILHTAAHMLHKAVVSLSGVNDIVIEYALLNPGQQAVMIWERYEGGIGISEIIRGVFQGADSSDPIIGFYRELLYSALCPVHLARNNLTIDELFSHLSREWGLPEDDELIVSVVSETSAERRAQENLQAENIAACLDGCPTCIQTTQCFSGQEQHRDVSRLVAQEIIKCFFHQRLDLTQVQSTNAYLLDQGMPHLTITYHNEDEDLFDAVQF